MLTVILCTHNGTDTLDRTLRAFCSLTPPPGGWNLVIVDNASTDGTPELIQRYAGRLPMLSLCEINLGKPHALNTGIAHATGDFVVFADDDILPEPNWLLAWREAADRYPEIGVFGGAIVPVFEVPPPDWLLETSWLTVLYSGTAPTLAEGPKSPDAAQIYGANMAVRTEVLEAGLRYDPVYMAGPDALMGDETDFVTRASRAGFVLGFAPAAKVGHIVNRTQVTWRWILRRFYRHGRSLYQSEMAETHAGMPQIAGVPRYMLVRILKRSLQLPLALPRGGSQALMTLLRGICYDLGAIRQARQMQR
jgi:GT2 family glycosyltransferase